MTTPRSGTVEMTRPNSLEGYHRIAGLPVIPGILNIKLVETFDLSLLKYLNFADIGWEFDSATQRTKYEGEIGMYCSWVTVVGKYPAFLAFFTWVRDIYIDAELISLYRLRSTLGLQDGDIVEFRPSEDYKGKQDTF